MYGFKAYLFDGKKQKEADMLMLRRIPVLAVMIMAGMTTVFAGGGAHWSYLGNSGPHNWGELLPEWAVCGTGSYQSPIDLRGAIEAPLGGVDAQFRSTPLEFGLDGPTFAVPYKSGSWVTINGTRYQLQAFHFHHPSEHTVDGKHYPMEGHMVLRSEGSSHNNAVMGVFIDVGEENGMLDQFWNQLPRSGNKQVNPVMVNVGDLLPADKAHFMYSGSMTTPGCGQGVRWFVLEHPVEASQPQIDRFITDFTQGDSNNRPIQPANGRWILKGK